MERKYIMPSVQNISTAIRKDPEEWLLKLIRTVIGESTLKRLRTKSEKSLNIIDWLKEILLDIQDTIRSDKNNQTTLEFLKTVLVRIPGVVSIRTEKASETAEAQAVAELLATELVATAIAQAEASVTVEAAIKTLQALKEPKKKELEATAIAQVEASETVEAAIKAQEQAIQALHALLKALEVREQKELETAAKKASETVEAAIKAQEEAIQALHALKVLQGLKLEELRTTDDTEIALRECLIEHIIEQIDLVVNQQIVIKCLFKDQPKPLCLEDIIYADLGRVILEKLNANRHLCLAIKGEFLIDENLPGYLNQLITEIKDSLRLQDKIIGYDFLLRAIQFITTVIGMCPTSDEPLLKLCLKCFMQTPVCVRDDKKNDAYRILLRCYILDKSIRLKNLTTEKFAADDKYKLAMKLWEDEASSLILTKHEQATLRRYLVNKSRLQKIVDELRPVSRTAGQTALVVARDHTSPPVGNTSSPPLP